jgi:hypothetical protein
MRREAFEKFRTDSMNTEIPKENSKNENFFDTVMSSNFLPKGLFTSEFLTDEDLEKEGANIDFFNLGKNKSNNSKFFQNKNEERLLFTEKELLNMINEDKIENFNEKKIENKKIEKKRIFGEEDLAEDEEDEEEILKLLKLKSDEKKKIEKIQNEKKKEKRKNEEKNIETSINFTQGKFEEDKNKKEKDFENYIQEMNLENYKKMNLDEKYMKKMNFDEKYMKEMGFEEKFDEKYMKEMSFEENNFKEEYLPTEEDIINSMIQEEMNNVKMSSVDKIEEELLNTLKEENGMEGGFPNFMPQFIPPELLDQYQQYQMFMHQQLLINMERQQEMNYLFNPINNDDIENDFKKNIEKNKKKKKKINEPNDKNNSKIHESNDKNNSKIHEPNDKNTSKNVNDKKIDENTSKNKIDEKLIKNEKIEKKLKKNDEKKTKFLPPQMLKNMVDKFDDDEILSNGEDKKIIKKKLKKSSNNSNQNDIYQTTSDNPWFKEDIRKKIDFKKN